MLLSIKNTTIAAVCALAVALPAAPALAWGKKEQGIVTGIAAAVLVDQMIKNNRDRNRNRAPVYQPAPPRYYHQQERPSHGHNNYQRPTQSNSLYATPVAQAFRSYGLQERRAIQRSLRANGYYYGAIDGTFGPGTYQAVRDYARDSRAANNLNSTGGAFAIYDSLIY